MRINHPFVKAARRWLQLHPTVAFVLAVLSVALISFPQWAASAWALFSSTPLIPSLIEKIKAFRLPQFSVYWITTPLGLVLLGVIVYLLVTGRKTVPTNRSGDISERPATKDGVSCSDQWLHKIAARQAESIHNFVGILDCTLLYKELDSAAPFVNFNFHLLNLSVYSLSIDKAVDGWVNFAGRRLGGHPRRTDNYGNFGHGQSGYVVITQWLSKEDVALIRSANEQCMFSFEQLEISIEGDQRFAEDKEVIKQKLDITCKIERVGQGVLNDDPQQIRQERDDLKRRLEEIVSRPRLMGFFQEASANYYYDELKKSLALSALFEPHDILGTDIVIYVRIVNVNPTPTTLHNFSLMIQSEGKQWIAEYPKEPEPPDSNVWTPPEIADQEKRMTNLITYLNNPDKILT